MKIWQKGEGVQFNNSNVCFGESFAPESPPLDMAVIRVEGGYPSSGFIYNEEAHEMVYVAEGNGQFKEKDGAWQDITSGCVVYVEPLTRFVWKSDGMTLVMPCSPQFDPTKHHEEQA